VCNKQQKTCQLQNQPFPATLSSKQRLISLLYLANLAPKRYNTTIIWLTLFTLELSLELGPNVVCETSETPEQNRDDLVSGQCTFSHGVSACTALWHGTSRQLHR